MRQQPTNPRSETNETQDTQQSGSKIDKSIGVRASNKEKSDSENDGFSLRASKLKDLKHPAKPLFQNEADVDVTILSNAQSDKEDYPSCTVSRIWLIVYSFKSTCCSHGRLLLRTSEYQRSKKSDDQERVVTYMN